MPNPAESRRRFRMGLLALAASFHAASWAGQLGCTVDSGSTWTLKPGDYFDNCPIGGILGGAGFDYPTNHGTIINTVALDAPVGPYLAPGAIMFNDGTFYNRAGGRFTVYGSGGNMPGGSFYNQGANTLLKIVMPGGGFGAWPFANSSGTFYNSDKAQVLLQQQQFENSGDTTYGPALAVNELNAGFQVSAGSSILNDNHSVGASTTFINRSGGWINLDAGTSLTNGSGATFSNRDAGTSITAAAGAIIDNVGTFSGTSGAVLWSSGQLLNHGGGTLGNFGAGTTITAIGTVDNGGSGTLLWNHAGAATYLGNAVSTPATSFLNHDGATLRNSDAGSILRMYGGVVLTNRSAALISNEAGASFSAATGTVLSNEAGAFVVNDGSGSSFTFESGARLDNAGRITNQNTAYFAVLAGAQLNNASGGMVINNGGGSFANGGAVSSVGGLVSNYGVGSSWTISAGGTFTSTGGTAQAYNNLGGQFVVTGAGSSLTNMAGSAFSNTGVGTDGSATTLGVSLGATLVNTGAFTKLNNTTGALIGTFGGSVQNLGGASLLNDGAGTKIQLYGGSMVNENATFTNSGGATLVMQGQATLENRKSAQLLNTGAGSLLDIQGGTGLTNRQAGVVTNQAGATINVAGTLVNDSSIANSASVVVTLAGQVTGVGSYVQTGSTSLTQVSGRWSQASTQILGGSFTGVGPIGGAFVNRATVASSTSEGLTFAGAVSGDGYFGGKVTFNGSLDPGIGVGGIAVNAITLGATDRLHIEIGGKQRSTGYDNVMGGMIALGGALAVDFVAVGSGVGTFVASAGDSFDIVQGQTLTGDFSSLLLPTLGAGLAWAHSIVNIPGGGASPAMVAYRLSVTAVPEPGTWATMLAGLSVMGMLVRRRGSKFGR